MFEGRGVGDVDVKTSPVPYIKEQKEGPLIRTPRYIAFTYPLYSPLKSRDPH